MYAGMIKFLLNFPSRAPDDDKKRVGRKTAKAAKNEERRKMKAKT